MRSVHLSPPGLRASQLFLGTGLSCCYCCCCAVDDDLHRMKLLNLLVEDAAEESEALVREGSEM